MKATYSNVYAVIELKKKNRDTARIYRNKINTTLICDNYYDYDDTDDDDNYIPDEEK